MTVFELIFFMLHLAVFGISATVIGREHGWLAGLIAGVVAVCVLVAFEQLLAAWWKRRRNGT